MRKGKAISGGIGIGPAVVWDAAGPADSVGPADPAPDVTVELRRLEATVATARLELERLRDDARARLGAEAAAILEVQLLMLDDPELTGKAADLIRTEGLRAPDALQAAGEAMAEMLSALDDPYLRERAADVRDVTGRLLRHLRGEPGPKPVPQGAVLVATDLPPSELLRLGPGVLGGLVLRAGGETSHTAILVRTMAIPAVFGVGPIPAEDGDTVLADGDTVLVDGSSGLVAVNPSPELLAEYRQRIAAQQQEQAELDRLRDLPAETKDGRRIQLAANIGNAHDAAAARAQGAEGVGLFRTEFLFLDRSEPPSEEEQYSVYREAVEAMAPHPVLIRTLDIGGDKPLPFLGLAPEENPFLGLRGIRLCQRHIAMFRTQLRAILRAACHGRVQVMVPMVSTRHEVLWVRDQLASVSAELEEPPGPVELGIMVETPAAALMARELAPLVDFFSIGTNDLTQYTLAVDRLNAEVAGLYDPLHPAVLRLVRMVVEGAHQAGRWVGMCGELAGRPEAAALLLGLGLDELSMAGSQVARVKRAIRCTDMAAAGALAERALSRADGDEVRGLLGQG